MFPCNNGKYFLKYRICDSKYHCRDNSDESKTVGALLGMYAYF